MHLLQEGYHGLKKVDSMEDKVLEYKTLPLEDNGKQSVEFDHFGTQVKMQSNIYG